MKRINSEKIFKDAEGVLVGGVNSPVRAFNSVGGRPLIIDYGYGPKIYDVDENGYTDYCLGWGALILGHAHRNVVLAARKRVNKGIGYGVTTKAEVEIAQHITRQIPSIELIRFVNSGTEATMSAVRLARGFTKRDIVLKFDGCYHGHFDCFLIKAGSGVAKLKESSSSGIPQSHLETTISLPYNDSEIAAETLERFKNEIACVIVEPVAGNMGTVPACPEFLKTLREFTKKFGIVLIFDEIITGFRASVGGAQSEYGIYPDLTCLGKIIGGGFPVGAYGGRKDIMSHLAPLGSVYQAGTFSGNPIVMRAGLSTLKFLNKSFYDTLNAKSEQLAASLNEAFNNHGIPAQISHYKSMLSLRFKTGAINNYDQARAASNDKLYGQLFWHLIESGIYWPPADLETFFISGVHTQKDLSKLQKAVVDFFVKQFPKQNKERPVHEKIA